MVSVRKWTLLSGATVIVGVLILIRVRHHLTAPAPVLAEAPAIDLDEETATQATELAPT